MSENNKSLVEEFAERYSELRGEYRQIVVERVQQFMRDNKITRIGVPVNNYAFNDGSEEVFRLYFDCITVTFEDGAIYESYDQEDESKRAAYEAAVDFLESFDHGSFYENIFGADKDDCEWDLVFSLK